MSREGGEDTAVGNIPHTTRQRIKQLRINPARDLHGAQRAIDGDNAVEASAAAFGEEFGAVGCIGGDEVGNGGEGVPSISGAVIVSFLFFLEVKVYVYGVVLPNRPDAKGFGAAHGEGYLILVDYRARCWELGSSIRDRSKRLYSYLTGLEIP